jgi:zinc transport system permease protein
MIAFFRDLAESPFLLNGMAAGLLASVACGVIGPYVVTRRIVFLSGAIAHMAVGGIGAAIYLAATFPAAFQTPSGPWLQPIHGAMAAALLGAVILGVVHHRATERMDTLIGALWAVGMAVGILLIKFTRGYHAELMSYLFGSLAIVDARDLWRMLVLDAVILAVVVVCHKRLLAICLDQEQAELQGINVLGTSIVLLCLVALTVISLTQLVGLILVIALVSLPAATAAHHVTRMAPLFVVSTLLCAVLTTVPRIAVYGTSVSPESAIVLSAAGVYLLSVLARRFYGRFRRSTSEAA